MQMIYKNKKNQKCYVLLCENVTNCTNAQDQQRMCLYTTCNDPNKYFVRERTEFMEKFEEVDFN
jgi:hypothetical protein